MLVFGSCFVAGAAAQTASNQVRPESGIYIEEGPMLRIEFESTFSDNQTTHNWEGAFASYLNVALKPVLRRELRNRPDVFRNKYLTLRGGYLYRTSLNNRSSSTESRAIVELTSRYLLPRQFVISDRNRGELQFVEGKPFSSRYRNRFRLERDIGDGWLNFTPYAYAEFFYDTRYDQWTGRRYAVGVQFPAGSHVVVEPYYFRQNTSHSSTPRINTAGLKLSFFVGR